ncbi:MAG TPA: AI-2E family transporter, partial [Candidatus Acidoferrum sp.]|nr:AI-2E family transporter [Candidatus Acidoferrum sp.]
MSLARPITFWIAAVAIGLAVLVVLRDIMLPFVAGMALAYLLDPVVRRLQRFGVRRSLSTLAIMALFMISTGALIVFTVPLIAADISAFVENLPTYMRRLQGFVTDPSRP